MKRYAIVRVEHLCPALTEKGINICKTDKNCKNKCPYKYGDTKEQLINKVAQALEICKNKGYRNITSEEYAKEIVEFLGVEE